MQKLTRIVLCYGWIHGYGDGTFRPNNPITRAEVTAIVNNMLDRAADEDFVDEHADELTPFSDIEKHWAYYHIVEATNDHDYTKPSSGENWTKCIFRPSESKETVGVSPPSREKQVQVHGRESTGVLFGKKWQRNASQSAPPRVIYSDWNPFLLRMESSPSMRIL